MSDDDRQISFIHPVTGKQETCKISEFSEEDQQVLNRMTKDIVSHISVGAGVELKHDHSNELQQIERGMETETPS